MTRTAVSDTIFVDTQKPRNAKIHSPYLLSNVTSTRNILLKWSAFDPARSSGLYFEIQFKRNPAGKWTTWKTGVTWRRRYYKDSIGGTTYFFRIRAMDGAGNVGDWSKADSTIVPYDQNQMVVSRIGFIHTRLTETNKFYNGTLRYSIHPGFRIKYKFTGRSVYLVSILGLGRGRAKIYIDGKWVKTIDTYDRDTRWRKVVFSKKWTDIGTHTLEVVNLGTPGRPRVDIDALGVGR